MTRSLLIVGSVVLPACFNPTPLQGMDDGTTTATLPGTTESPGTSDDGTSVATSSGTTTDGPPSTTDGAESTSDSGVVDTGSSGDPDPCADDPCVNGTCVPQGDAPSCTCDDGWAGDLCDACDEGFVLVEGMCVVAASCAADPCGPGAMCDEQAGVVTCTRVFSFTGANQPWAVPAGVMSVDAVALGAGGGCALGGLGGEASATVPVMPGQILNIHVGGAGTCGMQASLPGGYNGGGDKFTDAGDSWEGGSGGGGTDLRRGGNTLADRVLVAGGGGGQGWGGQAGHGGGELGQTCDGVGGGCGNEMCGGGGGSQNAGGTAGYCFESCQGQPGSLGVGGTSDGCAAAGGGGGGGYYGGGGGAHCSGGGGSSLVNAPGNANPTTMAGVNAGDGQLTLVWMP